MLYHIRRFIPSMYQRRLLLIAACATLVLLVFLFQLTRLTVVQGHTWRLRAEGALSQRRLISTVRGTLLDRKGRVLAQDRASFDVTVSYPMISGQWAYDAAVRAARASVGGARYRIMDETERAALIRQHQEQTEAQVELLWKKLSRLGGIDQTELEEHKNAVIRRVQKTAGEVWLKRLSERTSEAGGEEGFTLAEVAQPISEQTAAHAILIDIDDTARLEIERLIGTARNNQGAFGNPVSGGGQAFGLEAQVWREVFVEPSTRRQYPLETMVIPLDRSHFPGPLRSTGQAEVRVEGVGLHLIGMMRDTWKEDELPAQRPFKWMDGTGREQVDLGGYLPGDKIGRWGVEKSQEALLRGSRGQLVTWLDSGQQEHKDPLAGKDLTLSIDIQLQARLQALMDPKAGLMIAQPWHRKQREDDPEALPSPGESLCGAALVLSVESGEVLAAVSTPGISLRQIKERPSEVWNDAVNMPHLFRPVGMAYEPGSTAKPLVLAAAATEGLYFPGETIHCGGMFDPHLPGQFRCWIYRQFGLTHGDLSGRDAIGASCNIFFYTLGKRMGAQRLTDWYRRFGAASCLLGYDQESELSEETAGHVPNLARLQALGRNVSEGEAMLMGIGQGPVTWTVLEAANTYATLANGGRWREPTFFVTPVRQRREGDLRLSPRGVQEALAGMDEVVNNPDGTGNHISALGRDRIFDISGVRVIGKSGTADASPRRVDEDRDKKITGHDPVVRLGAHAWFIALVTPEGENRPKYVVAVVVEYAGSGAAVSGPVVNAILHALRAEGYL